jgi:hypothetical protein
MPNDENDNQQQTEIIPDPNDTTTSVASANSSGNAGDDDDPEFANMTVRERALVTKARAQEKRKLYKDRDTLQTQVRDLQTQLRTLQQAPAPVTATGEVNRDAAMERLTSMIAETQNQLRDMQQSEVKRRQEAELKRYAADRISEMRAKGKPVVASLVGGNTEEEIEYSLSVARAEYVLTEEEVLAANGGRRGNNGSPASVTVQTQNGRPTGTPPVMTPNSVEADSENEIITQITSDPDAAVRSGAYSGKNRTQILGKLKRGYQYGR